MMSGDLMKIEYVHFPTSSRQIICSVNLQHLPHRKASALVVAFLACIRVKIEVRLMFLANALPVTARIRRRVIMRNSTIRSGKPDSR